MVSRVNLCKDTTSFFTSSSVFNGKYFLTVESNLFL